MNVLFRLTAKNVLQRPLRYLLTSFAIVFSVAVVSAVFIFTGGLRTTFDQLATNIESGYDIAVQPNIEFGDGFIAPTVPLEIFDLVESVEGVGEISPRVVGFGVVSVDADGVPGIAQGGTNLGVAWGDDAGSAARYFVQEGRRPASPDEFAIDVGLFELGNYEVGERYVLQVPNSSTDGQTFELTGTFTFGSPDNNSTVGAQLVALDTPTAIELINGGDGFSDLTLLVDEGEEIEDVIARIEPLLDDSLAVLSQEEVIERTQGDFGQILTIFQTVLLVFAIILTLVSAFLIFNVFSITLGQRIRELGLLRAIGAFGSQVTQLMIGEALFLGIASALIGFPAGLGLAWLLRAALSALGFPDNVGLPITGTAVIAAFIVGVVVTVAAATVPALQAQRVPPIAALRDGALLQIERITRPGRAVVPIIAVAVLLGFVVRVADGWVPRLGLPLLAALLLWIGLSQIDINLAKFGVFVLGTFLLVVALVEDAGLGATFALIGAGAFITIVGTILLMPFIATRLTSVLGRAPTAVVLGLIGVALGIAALANIGGAIFVAATGTPDFVIDASGMDVSPVALIVPLLIFALIMAVVSYAIVRTAIGARGLSGQVARANAARNPQRTATTAAALMIGLTLVTAVTVIGDSIKASVSAALSSSITADWLIQAGQGGGPQAIPFSTEVAERLEALDEIESVLEFRVAFPAAWATSESGELNAADFQEFLPIILQLINDDADLSPEEIFALQQQLGTDININDASATDISTLEDHNDPDWIELDQSLVGPNAVYFEQSVAEEAGLEVGDTFSALFIDLESEDLVLAGIYDNGFVLGNRVMDLDLWNRHFPSDSDQFLSAITASGVPQEDARIAMEEALAEDFPIIEIRTREEFAENTERQINQTLATVNVLLGLSGVVAALGILVALALSVFERTREIGLFRAVGATRQQTRWIIRWEGVIVAAFGGLTGVLIGVPIGVLATSKMPEFLVNQISVPIPTLVFYLLFASIVGLFAAVFPAWTAGRLNVLDAISAD